MYQDISRTCLWKSNDIAEFHYRRFHLSSQRVKGTMIRRNKTLLSLLVDSAYLLANFSGQEKSFQSSLLQY